MHGRLVERIARRDRALTIREPGNGNPAGASSDASSRLGLDGQLSNIDLYKRLMEQFAARDFGAMREMMDEEVRSENLAPANAPIAGDRIGVDALMDYFVLAAEPTADYEFLEAHAWLESGEVVVAIGREAYRIKATGKRAETPFVHETRWKDGRLVFWREFYDTAAMRDAYSPEP